MYLIGDIGNTEVKIVLFNSNKKVVKRIFLKTKKINDKYLSKKMTIDKKYLFKINKILFSSVVPLVFSKIKLFLNKKVKKNVLN